MPRKSRKVTLGSRIASAQRQRHKVGEGFFPGAAPAVGMPRSTTLVAPGADHQRGRGRQQEWHRRCGGGRRGLAGTLQPRPDNARGSLRLVAQLYRRPAASERQRRRSPAVWSWGPASSAWSSAIRRPTTDPVGEFQTASISARTGPRSNCEHSSDRLSTLTYPTLGSDTSYGPLETVTERSCSGGGHGEYYAPTSTRWARRGRSPVSMLPPGRQVPRAWGSPAASTALPAALPCKRRYRGQRGKRRVGDQYAFGTDLEHQPDRERVELPRYRRQRPLRQRPRLSGHERGRGVEQLRHAGHGNAHDHDRQAGYYTFGVNSDDGFLLSITGASFTNGSGDHPQRQQRWSTMAGGCGRHPGYDLPGRGQLSDQPDLLQAGAMRAWNFTPPRRAVPRE